MSEVTLIEDGPERNRLRVQLTEFRGTPLLQLRFWYKDKETDEFKPTRKGLALSKNNYLAVKSVISDFHDDVMQHLGYGAKGALSDGDHEEVKASRERQIESVSDYQVRIEPLRPVSKLYEMSFEGSVASLVLNSSHPFVSKLEEAGSIQSMTDVISMMLVAVELSRHQSEGADLTAPSVTLEVFLDHFQRILSNLARSAK